MNSPANNNSSSSPPIPNRPNPKPRNSETGDPLRRSFKDFTRRNSFGGDKENETKAFPTPKGSKNFMLPTISAVSKINASPRKKVLSDKNEMSRSFDLKGQVLDNNKSHHRAKSCVSFSDVLQIIGNDKDEQMFGVNGEKELHDMTVIGDDKDEQIFGINGKKKLEESHDMTVTDFDEKEVLENKGIAYSDPRFRISPRPCAEYTSPEFAGSEVDSKILPYDPKKNYLSPRPQFLHYKPNPRIEHHFDECKQLEELFISESSSSDTDELSVEESESCEEQDKNVAEVEVVEETEDVEQLEAESDEKVVCESIEEASQVPTQSGFRKLKFLGLFLTLSMAYLLVSATFSLPAKSPFHKFHIPREFTEFGTANNLELLSEKFWTLTESSFAYVDKLISGLGGGQKEFGPLQYYNLTYMMEDDTAFQPTSVEISEGSIQEKIFGGYNLGDVYVEDGYVNEFEDRSLAEEVVSETKDGVAEIYEFDEQTEMIPGTDIGMNADEGNLDALLEDGIEWNTEEQTVPEVNFEENEDAGGSELQEKLETTFSNKDQEETDTIYTSRHNVKSAAIFVPQPKESVIAEAESGLEEGFRENAAVTDLHLEVRSSNKADSDLAKTDAESVAKEPFEEIAGETSDDLHLEVRSSNKADHDVAKTDAESVSEEASGEIAGETSDDHHHRFRFSNELILVLSSTMLVVLAAAAFSFAKKGEIVAASAPKPALETTEKLTTSHVPVESLIKEKLSSLNFEAEVDDRMSKSFPKNSSFHKDPESKGESKKSNNSSSSSSSKFRRESMASSASEFSIDSISYGSFTTFEKVPTKNGDGEQEIITPVRRSNRIRKNQPSGL